MEAKTKTNDDLEDLDHYVDLDLDPLPPLPPQILRQQVSGVRNPCIATSLYSACQGVARPKLKAAVRNSTLIDTLFYIRLSETHSPLTVIRHGLAPAAEDKVSLVLLLRFRATLSIVHSPLFFPSPLRFLATNPASATRLHPTP